MIHLKNICKFYKHSSILTDINCYIRDNDILAVLGDSDSGKTDLLMVIAMLKKYNTGVFTITDTSLQPNFQHFIRYIPSGILYYKHISVKAYLHMVSKSYNIDTYDDINRLCDKFDIDLSQNLCSMSYNQNRCVCFIQALITKPKLLILDEPYTYLDPDSYKLLKDELLYQNKQGMTIIVSAEDSSDIINFCNSFIYMQQGNVITGGTLSKYQKKLKVVTVYSSNANLDTSNIHKLSNHIIYTDNTKTIFLYKKNTQLLKDYLQSIHCFNFLIEPLTIEENIFKDYTRWTL